MTGSSGARTIAVTGAAHVIGDRQGVDAVAETTRVEDIAATVRFLLSSDASLITGQAVNVDGGIEVH